MIREATPEDTPRLLVLAKAFHYAARLKRFAAFEESVESWAAWIDSCTERLDAVCLLSEDDEGRVQGFATAVLTGAFWNPAVRFVQETALWVDPEARGKGHGSQLLSAVEEWARKQGVQLAAAGASQGCQPKAMRRMLERSGYALEERMYLKHLET
ncbi:MAG: GNAT family N-acetyltransferase [Deltaproteobacteria bacterium]|nr:GNAT family N-acetyltransferase [Deltaproteobacteria bacterium]